MRMLSRFMVIGAMVLLSACANERIEPQKSPCVGIEGSPCGPKRAVNA